ncbi:hypothetical protein D0860_03472 [Hortaea werneckii]|uniref:Uncharacterized protein n=1 Tax=Hortaea werneckii TaxID=91943 RepID=A0A3M7HDF5_HORWE|nr:hypothetical protein D0860_03472 [Hortaea werneckii]
MGSIQQPDMNNMTKTTSSPTTPTQSPTPPPQTSPLLTLPPELRNKIYSLALTPTTTTTKTVPAPTGQLQRPALLKTNTQLRAETTQMYFASTCIQIPLNPSNLSNLQHFLQNLGRANLAVLGGLELVYTNCIQAGGGYTHPSTRQQGVLGLLVMLAEAGVRMDAVEVSTAKCKCREGGRCKSSARAYGWDFGRLVGGFRITLEGERG